MLLYELYKVSSINTVVLLYDRAGKVIYYGSFDKLNIDILQSRVTYLRPIAINEIIVKIDI